LIDIFNTPNGETLEGFFNFFWYHNANKSDFRIVDKTFELNSCGPAITA